VGEEDNKLMGNRVNRMRLIENKEFLEAENQKIGWMDKIGLNTDQSMLNRSSYGGKASFKNMRSMMNKYSESPPESPAINDDGEQDLWN
jgi:hypothetical protein